MENIVQEPTNQYLPNKIVLLGDSIFDNAPYVNDGESVSEQLTRLIQTKAMETAAGINAMTTQVELLAVDGHVFADIPSQLARADQGGLFGTQYAFLSCGGNDLLQFNVSGLLKTPSSTIGDSLDSLDQVREYFREEYETMLTISLKQYPHLAVCTIYDNIPTLSNAEKVALALFNEVILREAAKYKLAVIDLRVICDHINDYAPVSPIEPSKQGAAKIARAILNYYEHCENKVWGV